MIIGDGYIEDLNQQSDSIDTFCVGDDALHLKELERLHKFLTQINCPSWHTPPPQNPGEASHGKLKADQWQSAIEFDIPTAIAHVCVEIRASSPLFYEYFSHILPYFTFIFDY